MKILLVEDEPIVRKTLQQKILNCCDFCEIVGSVSNGRDALALIATTNPDIVFTDIKMPIMDGLELLQQLNNKFPKIIPIVLTGYEEFEYAHKAIRFGVFEYLLKPVDVKDLKKCIDKCQHLISKQFESQNIMIEENQSLLQHFDTNAKLTIVYCIFANPLRKFDSTSHPSFSVISNIILTDIVNQHVPNNITIKCYDGMFSNEKVFIIDTKDITEKEILFYLNKIAKSIAFKFQTYITIQLKENLYKKDLYRALRVEHSNAIKNVKFGVTQIYTEVLPPNDIIYLTQNTEVFSILVRKRDYELLCSNIKIVLEQSQILEHPLIEVQKHLVYFLGQVLNDCGIPFYTSELDYLVENIVCFSNDQMTLMNNFSSLMMELSNSYDYDYTSNSGKDIVLKIENHFSTHISDNITLEMLSEEFNISKVYLCRIFKKYKNTTPIAYFSKLKIDHAKQMIEQFSYLPIHKISEKLGFNDIYYFSKQFKKIQGKPPSAFRK